jgi:phage replication O-like protein O
MANPQKEHGYTAIAHELMEALMAANLSGGQFRLLLCLLRQTYGFNRKSASMSASTFADMTGLHPKVVAREIRDLEARGLLLVLREEGRTSSYSLQKDYQRWQTGNQMVPGTGNHLVPPPGTDRFPPREPNGSRSYKEEKDNSKATTEPNGSGTLRDRFEAKYHHASNKLAVIGELFSLLLGAEPDYRRLGSLAKGLNSGGKLMDLIIEASRQRISDDPHDYLAAMVKRVRSETSPGKAGQADLNSGKRGRFVQ